VQTGLFAPLTDRIYRRLFIAQALSLVGTGLTTVALALLAYDLAGENAGAVLGTALALKMIAYVGIAPIVGAFAHRLPRRAFLVALDLIRASIVLFLPFVTEIWQVYVLIFVLQSCSAAFTPTFQATIPDVLPDEKRYTEALSLSRLAYDLEALLSPSIAAALLTITTFRTLFLGDAITFLVSAALVLSVVLPGAKRVERRGGVWSKTTYGLRLYLATPRLRGLLALNLAVAASGATVIVNTVVYVRSILGGSDSAVAWLSAAAGAGSMAAALFLPRVLDRLPERTVMIGGAVLLAVGLAAATTLPGFAIAAGLWLVLGVGSSLVQTPGGQLLRRSSHAEDRPALFAAHFALSHGCWLITYPAAGWIAATFDLSAAFAFMMVVVLVASGLAMTLWPRADPVEVVHEHGPSDHEHLHVHDEHHQHNHEGWEGPEPHRHPHRHRPVRHAHSFVIDDHHLAWPKA
jgi:MFS family permease